MSVSARARVKLNQAALARLERAKALALEMTAEAVFSDIVASTVVPKDIGTLERSGYVDASNLASNHVAVAFSTPYARRLYWHPEYNFRTDRNPNAQGKWMQTYIDGEKMSFAREKFREFLKRLSGGLVK